MSAITATNTTSIQLQPGSIDVGSSGAQSIDTSIIDEVTKLFEKILAEIKEFFAKLEKSNYQMMGVKEKSERHEEGEHLKRVFSQHANDPCFAKAATRYLYQGKGMHLEHIPKAFQDNEEVVVAANKNHGDSAQFASDRLKSDRNFVIKLVTDNGWALQHVDKRFRDDEEVVFAALSQTLSVYAYASDRIKKLPKFISEVEKYPLFSKWLKLELDKLNKG